PVNDAGVLFLGLLDATVFQPPAQHQDDIEPVLGHRHGRKNGSHLEKNSGLCRSDYHLTAAQDQFGKAVVQLDNPGRLAVEKLLDGELPAGMGLVAVFELATTPRADPWRSRFAASRPPVAHDPWTRVLVGSFPRQGFIRNLAIETASRTRRLDLEAI